MFPSTSDALKASSARYGTPRQGRRRSRTLIARAVIAPTPSLT
jgi:hypothetical protein